MKKFIAAGVIVLACAIPVITNSQSASIALNNEKKEIKLEEKEVRSKHRELRREDRAYEKEQVSYATRNNFAGDFPGAQNVLFTAGKFFEEASYTLNGARYTAYYDNQSMLVGTTTEKQFTDLPADGQKDITRHLLNKGYSVDKVILFDDNEANDTDMWIYDQPFQDEDVYFVILEKAGKQSVVEINSSGFTYLNVPIHS
jgi:hypothetical protein